MLAGVVLLLLLLLVLFLLVGAGLFLRSLNAVRTLDLGYRLEGIHYLVQKLDKWDESIEAERGLQVGKQKRVRRSRHHDRLVTDTRFRQPLFELRGLIAIHDRVGSAVC